MTPIRKLANAFYTDAEPSDRASGVARYSANRYQKTHGGLWVGGDVTIAESGVAFVPNTLNRNLHKDIRDVEIPQSTIKSIQYKFGWFTGIVEIHHEGGVFMFRCYGAKKLVAQLNKHGPKP